MAGEILKLFLLMLSGFPCVLGQRVACSGGMECRPQLECPQFVEETEKLSLLTKSSNEYREKLSELKNLICDKKDKKVCCISETRTDSPGRLEDDRTCSNGRECRAESDCPGFQLEKTKLNSLDRGSKEYQEKLTEIKDLVCNRKSKKVCCVPEPDEGGCSEGRECRPVADCPLFELEKTQLTFMEKGTDAYQQKLTEIKELVCSTREKKVCCLRNFIELPTIS